MLLRIKLNGLDVGTEPVGIDGDALVLPVETLAAMHIKAVPGQPLRVQTSDGAQFKLDTAASTLTLDLPASMFELQRFAPDTPTAPAALSPEIWGAFVNYDINVRQALGGAAMLRNRSPAAGGTADLRLLGPDLLGSFGWAGDTSQGNAPIRLDSVMTWRPANASLAVSVGDLLSPGDPMSLSRPYRFGGVQIGTDHSGSPGWSSAVIPSFSGTAQAQSSLDLFINDQRAYSASTPGGPFSLTLPAGISAGGASLVVKDVTGRAVILPVDVPRVDAQLIRPDILLWSAGVGVPRFGYGTSRSTYAPDPYAYGTVRFGLTDRVTLRSEAEIGRELADVQIGADAIVMPELAVRGTFDASYSDRGVGGAGRLGLSYVGPFHLGFDLSAQHSFGNFDDVVSVSARSFARRNRMPSTLSLPSESDIVARVSWQASERLTTSVSYQASRFPQSGTVGIASFSASYTVGNIPLFFNAFHSLGGRRSTTVVAGISVQLGAVQGSVSGGTGFGGADRGQGWTGTVNAGQPLNEEVGSVGWTAFGARSPTDLFGAAQTEYRSGFGIPGIGVQSFGRAITGLATARGSFGVVGGHPFLGDPVSSGIIIVDAERSGVPVQLNGFDRGQTSFDGKLALVDMVAGVPQNVAIDTNGLPFDEIPTVTDGQSVVRIGGASSVAFRVRSSGTSARFHILFNGAAPPVGSTVVSVDGSAPLSKEGRGYLLALKPNEVIRVDMPDGSACLAETGFDGRGSVGRDLGNLVCNIPRQ